MCPRGVAEVVTCKEQSTYSVSVCKDDQQFFMSFQSSPLSRAIIFPAIMEEEADSFIFTRLNDGENVLELTIKKSVDDHTLGTLKIVDTGVVTHHLFRCLTRNINQ